MYRLCAERGMVMERVFDNVTVCYLSQLAAKLGKDKILQVCKMCELVVVLILFICMYVVHNVG